MKEVAPLPSADRKEHPIVPQGQERKGKARSRDASGLTLLSSQQSGTLGELLAVAKLNTLGFSAYISPEGAPGHDLIVVAAGRPLSVEVKTRQFLDRPSEISRWPVDMDTKGEADFFLFVELGLRSLAPTFYLLDNAQAREVHRDYAGGGNCTPAHVRRITKPDDFTALIAMEGRALP